MNGNIVGELARVTVEDYYNEDMYEALEALAMEELGEEPTPEMEQAARDAACYGLDDRALCIGDETDDGTPIPEWAFC
jgi:hypothetical protein|tara:strand:- start:1132 stop:1365 length:234 start_codon:yes stop_codon:yes gene_type:complete